MSKMNRGRSEDSLDNGMNDIISSGSSSSPTDFTSDDEIGTCNNIYMMSGQANKASNKVDKYLSRAADSSARIENARQRASVLGPNNSQNRQPMVDEAAVASTSYYRQPSRVPDVIPLSPALMPDQVYEQQQQRFNPRQRFAADQTSERPLAIMGVPDDETVISPFDDSPILKAQTSLMPHDSSSSSGGGGGSGSMNTITVRLCGKLVECRTLSEAIDFVDRNRDLIVNLTRIVTREAPAFRNYDMSNYQIDHTVRDSFNENFWLDREPVVTTADGNCQYHAVSIGLTGTELYTPEVRLATAVAVVDNRDWFESMLKLIDRGTVLDLVREIARIYSWGDETTLKAIAVAIKRRIFLYTCNIGKKDYELVKSLTKEELLDAFKEKKYRGGTGIHTYADPLIQVPANNYIMLFHKSEHFIAVLPTSQQATMFEPYNPIVPTFS